MEHQLQITKPNATPALIIDPLGDTGRPEVMPYQLKSMLDRAFQDRPSELARKPGRLTTAINSLPPRDQNVPISPKLSVAAFTSRTVQRADVSTERMAAEVGILAQRDGCFHHNNHPMVAANGWKPTNEQIEELGKRTVDVYLANGFIRPHDTVIDIGTGTGFVAKHLEARGINVEAIEPGAGEVPGFPKAHRLTAKQFIEQHPGKRFSVVHAGNFSPLSNTGYLEMGAARQMLAELRDMTADDGSLLLGVSSMDPQFVSGTSEYRLRPHLEQNFEKVEYFSPKKLGEEFSIGGQMGVFKCSGPRRQAAAAQ